MNPVTRNLWAEENLENRLVRYITEYDGQLVVIEDVPARVNTITGEQLFSPETVNRIQAVLRNPPPPVRQLKTEVYSFAA